jgi:DNA-binding transcriptional LysR family regulator
MDFDQLATFVYVAKLKSFSRAGQKVFRSQSAVSAQIRQLEQAYRARLLDRSAKSVELTPAGEVLFEYAERLLRLRDESIQVVADRGDVVQGPLVFGANAIRKSTSASIAISAIKFCSGSKTVP